MTRVEHFTNLFRQTGGLTHQEGVELFEKVDIMRKFIEFLASGECYDLNNVYYEANNVLNKM